MLTLQDPSLLEKRLVLAGFMGCKRAVSPNGDAMVGPMLKAFEGTSTGCKAK